MFNFDHVRNYNKGEKTIFLSNTKTFDLLFIQGNLNDSIYEYP